MKYSIAALLPLTVMIMSLQSHAQSLQEAMQSALNYHPEIQAGINSTLSSQKNLRAAEGGYLPSVDLTGTIGREATDSPTTRRDYGNNDYQWLTRKEGDIRLRQMLFDGFATSSEVDRQRSTVNSRAYELMGKSETTALAVAKAYMEVIRRQSTVALAETNLKAHERIYEQIRIRKMSGVGLAADVDQADARLAQARNNLLTEQTNLADAKVGFRSVVGEEPESLSAPPAVLNELPVSLQEARDEMIQNNPQLRSAQSDVKATEAQYEAAKSKFYPRLTAELGGGSDDDLGGLRGYYNRWQALLRMSYNIYNGGSDQATLESRSFQINEAMDIRNNALRVLNEELGLAWNALESARQQMPIAKKYVDYSARVRELYQQQFSLGQRTLLDLLDSESELFAASLRLEEVRYVELLSQYRIEATVGSLLRSQGIAAPSAATPMDVVNPNVQLPSM